MLLVECVTLGTDRLDDTILPFCAGCMGQYQKMLMTVYV
jgi:hypothetical protein